MSTYYFLRNIEHPSPTKQYTNQSDLFRAAWPYNITKKNDKISHYPINPTPLNTSVNRKKSEIISDGRLVKNVTLRRGLAWIVCTIYSNSSGVNYTKPTTADPLTQLPRSRIAFWWAAALMIGGSYIIWFSRFVLLSLFWVRRRPYTNRAITAAELHTGGGVNVLWSVLHCIGWILILSYGF